MNRFIQLGNRRVEVEVLRRDIDAARDFIIALSSPDAQAAYVDAVAANLPQRLARWARRGHQIAYRMAQKAFAVQAAWDEMTGPRDELTAVARAVVQPGWNLAGAVRGNR
jgi:hypothetical protein